MSIPPLQQKKVEEYFHFFFDREPDEEASLEDVQYGLDMLAEYPDEVGRALDLLDRTSWGES